MKQVTSKAIDAQQHARDVQHAIEYFLRTGVKDEQQQTISAAARFLQWLLYAPVLSLFFRTIIACIACKKPNGNEEECND